MISTSQVRWFIVAVLVVVGGTIGYFILRPSGMGISVDSVSVVGSDADLKMDKIHIVQNKQGAKNWEMWADTAKVYRKKDHTKLENVHLRFYPKNGKIMDVTANNGLMENQSRNMRLRGNVLIKTQDGISMRTEALHFRPKEKKIDSDEKIFVKGDTFRLTGIGLRGRTDLGQYFLNKNVKAVIYESTSVGLSSFSNTADSSALARSGDTPTGGSKP